MTSIIVSSASTAPLHWDNVYVYIGYEVDKIARVTLDALPAAAVASSSSWYLPGSDRLDLTDN